VAQRLLLQHIADLRGSGLSDEQIVKCGFLSWRARDDAPKISAMLNWKRPYDGSLGDCLVIPFRCRDGSFGAGRHYARFKFDRPRKKKEGDKERVVKYEAPVGEPNRAYFPPGTLAALNDTSVPLIISEGEKKGAKADQEGFACISILGVWSWQKKRQRNAEGDAEGPRELIDDLAGIPWKGRLVFLAFDHDEPPNPKVALALWHLARALIERGAVVKVVSLPAGPNDAEGKPTKCGLDDFFVNGHTADDLRQLLAAATDPVEPPPTRAEQREKFFVVEAEGAPHRLARLFLRHPKLVLPAGFAPPVAYATLRLRYWCEEWYEWDGSAYRQLPPKELRGRLSTAVKEEFDRCNIEQ
jgi:hypothetical protein